MKEYLTALLEHLKKPETMPRNARLAFYGTKIIVLSFVYCVAVCIFFYSFFTNRNSIKETGYTGYRGYTGYGDKQ
ncbi:hypothetical protein [Pasteurella oralis]|uniref:hypothetical protein n=1 Tax=Pasteurella oralis TaxID=1071947 RepID=UPI000C798E09|nr:hypothetical protein [Pasteurella oralis]